MDKSFKLGYNTRIDSNILHFLFSEPLDKQNTITTIFKVLSGGKSAIFAYLYSISANQKLYYTFGPAYVSQDGEYRKGTKSFKHYGHIFDFCPDQFTPIEEMIIQKMNDNELEFRVEFYYPPKLHKEKREQFEENINNGRYTIKLFALCWITDFAAARTYISKKSPPSMYYNIIYNPADEQLYDKLISECDHSEQEIINNFESMLPFRAKLPLYRPEHTFITGQKIIPLTVADMENVLDVKYDIWRELWIYMEASKIILNAISPTFPLFSDWFYIYNSNFGLYDNTAMYIKYEQSDIANKIRGEIKTACEKGLIEGYPINTNFKILSERLHGSIGYIDSHIRLTDISLVFHMEHVGEPIERTANLINENNFMKVLFDFIYGVLCLNDKLHIAHGDIHSGNITIFNVFPVLNVNSDKKTSYKINDTYYIFSYDGIVGAIIDFSRSFSLIDQFGQQEREITNYIKRAELEPLPSEILRKNYRKTCEIVAPLDIYFLCVVILKKTEKIVPPIVTEIKNLVYENVKRGLNAIRSDVYNTLNQMDVIIPINILHIIEKYFAEYAQTELPNGGENIIERFVFNNKMEYDFENLPASFAAKIEQIKKINT